MTRLGGRALHSAHSAQRLMGVFGDLVTVDPQGNALMYRREDLESTERWIGQPLVDEALSPPVELLIVDRWLVIRDEYELRIIAGALIHNTEVPNKHLGFERPWEITSLLGQLDGRINSSRISSMGRLNHYLVILTVQNHAPVVKIVKIDEEKTTPWRSELKEVDQIPLSKNLWWIDRGSTQSNNRILVCSEHSVIIIWVNKQGEIRSKRVDLPENYEGKILIGQTIVSDLGIMMITNERNSFNIPWFFNGAFLARVANSPTDLEGIEHDLDQGNKQLIIGRTFSRRLHFDFNFSRFFNEPIYNSLTIKQVDFDLPCAIFFRDNVNGNLFIRIPGLEKQIPMNEVIDENTEIKAAIEGHRIWVLSQRSHQSLYVETFDWC
ncbi:hypothetical protein KKB55_21080 [Myxococcota bacterium]|nr:hypothetical protein [Myxococcota bacterium]MBU1900242.1 hypothetical protein [Myxococcota bacterium]